jgi:hypothetical protein
LSLAKAADSVELANVALCQAIDKDYRPSRLTDEDDFILQVNKRVESKAVFGVRLNLLVKYSVEKIQTLAFNMQGQMAVSVAEAIVPSITIDFNSRPEPNRSFDGQEAAKIIRELYGFAKTEVEKHA